MDTICLKAYAKINLGLDVVRRKENGYHEVKMIMQTISLHDVVKLEKRKEAGIVVRTNAKMLPADESNLVFKAAKLLFDEFQPDGGISIHLQKNIPIAAGLAGGSADAAAVLRGINQIYHLQLTQQELMDRGVKLGADIPYCIAGGTMLAEGIGEKLTELPPLPECYLLIAKPGVSVSTKWVYENLNVKELKMHPDIDMMIEAIHKKDIIELTKRMQNILENVTESEYPQIRKIKSAMKEQGALGAMMSGSGPSVFGIFDSYKIMEAAYQHVKAIVDVKEIYMAEVVRKYERVD